MPTVILRILSASMTAVICIQSPKTFFFVANEEAEQAGAHVSDKSFHLSLVFVRKAMSLPI
jgi:hypothetical protein